MYELKNEAVFFFASRYNASIKKKKIEKERKVKLSKIIILFANKKIYSIQFPYKYLLAMFITFSCVEMLKRDALCSESLF